MPKPVLLDPPGKAVSAVLARKGATGNPSVRIGKRFEVTIDEPITDEVLEEIRAYAVDLFSNPVIEDVVSVEIAAEPATPAPTEGVQA